MLYPRGLQPLLHQTINSRRVTVLTGPRQAGKTTLAEQALRGLGRGTMRRLDDPGLLEAANSDPRGFVASGERPVVIDEVQHAGDALVRAIKEYVDSEPTPGQFLLTGSVDFLSTPQISESLAGRAAFLDVWPLTQGELAGSPEQFLDLMFDDPDRLRSYEPTRLAPADYFSRVCRGGFPEAVSLPPKLRRRWFADYVRTLIERDITEQFGVRKVDELNQLLRLFAARTASELVMERVIADAAVAKQTVYDHRAWLEMAYLLHRVPAWSRNLTSRVKHRKKVFIPDSGLAAWLIGKDDQALAQPAESAKGPLLETFVANELLRQRTWADVEVAVMHWQDRDGGEIDLVLESSDGRVIGIEIKASASATRSWFKWLRRLSAKLGEQFVHGIALYTGSEVIPFGDRMTAVPVDALWELR